MSAPDDALTPDQLTRDRLTRDLWLWQRKRGHRFSVDDVVTAYVAMQHGASARHVLDLGCGIGSVLLHLAWCLPDARLTGIEAQAISYALAQKNIDDNALGERVTVHHGDLRDTSLWPALGRDFDLITGTPPYFPARAALPSEDEQRTLARLEVRGGVEAYIDTGAALLAPTGRLVICGDARADERVQDAARSTRLAIVARTDVVARAPNPPLFSVWTLAFEPAPCAVATIVIRDASGERSADAARLRAFSGL